MSEENLSSDSDGTMVETVEKSVECGACLTEDSVDSVADETIDTEGADVVMVGVRTTVVCVLSPEVE